MVTVFDPHFMEVINGALTIMTAWTLGFFAYYRFVKMPRLIALEAADASASLEMFRTDPDEWLRQMAPTDHPPNGTYRGRLANALLMVFVGVFVTRAPVWVQRHLANSGMPIDWALLAPLLGIGAAVMMFGEAMVILVCAPEGTGRGWACTAMSTSVLGAILIDWVH